MKRLTGVMLLTFLFSLLIGGSMVLGQALESTPEFFQHGPFCVLPCWQGINPGRTRIDPANQIMLNLGYNAEHALNNRLRLHYPSFDADQCRVQIEHREAVVTEMVLYCPSLRLGDMMLLLGQPEGIKPGDMVFYFGEGDVSIRLTVDGCAARLSPYSLVQEIRLRPGPDATRTGRMVQWRGFAPVRDYLQRSPVVLLLSC